MQNKNTQTQPTPEQVEALFFNLARTASPAQKQAVIEAGAKVLPAVTGKKAAPSVS